MGAAEVLTNAGGDGLRSYYRPRLRSMRWRRQGQDAEPASSGGTAQRAEPQGASHPPAQIHPVRSGRSERGRVAPVRGSGGAMHGCPTRRRIPRGGWAPRRRTRASTRRLQAPPGWPVSTFPPLTPPLLFFIAVRMLREEIQLLQEPGSYVGEVVKVMGKTKVLVKVRNDPSVGPFPPA